MLEPLSVPISVHCAIPIAERKTHRVAFMKKEERAPNFDPVLAENIKRLAQGVSVGRLRESIGNIGTGAIQAAKQGSTGMRLETLEKMASYFGVATHQLLQPDLGREVWPFTGITPIQLKGLPPKYLEIVENLALLLLDLSQNVDGHNEKTQSSVRPRVTFTVHKDEERGADSHGKSDSNEEERPTDQRPAGGRS